MADFSTLKLHKLLDELAEQSKNSIIPFSKVKAHTYKEDGTKELHTCDDNDNPIDYEDCIVYDDKDEIVENDSCKMYPVISMMLVNDLHHDIISVYSESYDYEINVVIRSDLTEESGNIYVQVTKSDNDDDDCIIVEDGKWYFA